MGILEKLFGDRAGEFRGGALPETHVLARGSLDRLPEVFHAGPLSTFERLCPVYKGQVQMAGGEGKDFRQVKVEGPSPEMLLRMGLTAYFFDVAGSVPQVRAARGELASALGIAPGDIRFSAWASPDKGGLVPHFDRYDGMIVQLQGKKLYRIGPCAQARHTVRQWSVDLPLDRLDMVQFGPDGDFPGPTDLVEVLLEPGSVLFLPRGYWHGTEARGTSFSVSIRFDPPTYADLVLDELRMLLNQDAEWRRPVYGAWGDAAAAAEERVARRLEALPGAVRRLSARHAFLSVDGLAEQLKWLGPETRFARDRTMRIEVDGRRARARSVWNGASFEVELPPGAEALVVWLAAEAKSFSLGELEARFPQVSGVRALVEALARGGAIKIVPFPTSTGA
jgi:hypothetical protein